jgi:hypothetical protein
MVSNPNEVSADKKALVTKLKGLAKKRRWFVSK